MTQVVYGSWVEVSAETARALEHPLRATSSGSSRLTARSRPRPTSRRRWPPGPWPSRPGSGTPTYGRFAPAVSARAPTRLLPAEPAPGSGGPRWLGVRVTLQKTGRREKLASPAGVTEIDHSREIFETVGLAEAVKLERGGQGAGAREPALDVPRPEVPAEPLGHGDRPRLLHGLPGVRRGLPGREQRALGRARPTSTTGGASSGSASSGGGTAATPRRRRRGTPARRV